MARDRARHAAKARNDGPADPAKRATLKKLGALGMLALLDAGVFIGCGAKALPAGRAERKVILLGLDGLDSGLVRDLLARGRLPNLDRLRTMGGLRAIASTTPPQSPVAWATVSTGCDPGVHGIYDFIQRDPKTYLPHFSIARSRDAERTAALGDWRIPLSHGTVESLRKGRAFWEYLVEAGVPADVYRVPSNFPPKDTGARQLAGLGAPDLLGTYGEFTYYTDTPLGSDQRVSGGEVYVVSPLNGEIRTRLRGPRNSLRKDAPDSFVNVTIRLDRGHRLAKITLQDQEALVKEGEWSDWLPVSFELLPRLASARGICRCYLQEVSPRFRMYITPVNVDPLDPALPVAAPDGFAQHLAGKLGRFYTQGFPHDVKALRSGVWDEDDYLHQSAMVFGEERAMFEHALGEFTRGLLMYVSVTTDRTQHMYWRAMDRRSPAYSPALGREYGRTIEECYRRSDGLVGMALDAMDNRTTLLVLSDHGFAPYHRSFSLNTWLLRNGYLAGADLRQQDADLFSSADWAATQAYGIGFNSLYLNLRGREVEGSVGAQERDHLLDRLAEQLREVRDPATGARVIADVARADRSFSARQPEREPDLVVGYAAGYRCSDSSVLGGMPNELFEDNRDKWSGDHCVAASCVPGTLASSRSVTRKPALQDVAASVLDEFGIPAPDEVTGKAFW